MSLHRARVFMEQLDAGCSVQRVLPHPLIVVLLHYQAYKEGDTVLQSTRLVGGRPTGVADGCNEDNYFVVVIVFCTRKTSNRQFFSKKFILHDPIQLKPEKI